MNSTGQNVTYCDFKEIKKSFLPYHNYLSLIICVFGSITNVLNIYILTSKPLRSPTNLILTGLALANLLVMMEYVPFVFLYNENKAYASHFTYNLAVFIIFHALFTQAAHSISCFLSVILAVWQYIAVKFPQNNNKWCSNQRTKITILLTYILCLIVCIPLNVSLKISKTEVRVDDDGKIVRKHEPATDNATVYLINYENEKFQHISSYVYAFVLKLIPCVLLTLLSSLLIVELLKAKERRKNLESNNKARKPSQRFLEKEKQADRTTRMLLAVLLLFLMVEFPQAIFGMLNIIIGKTFELECYQPLGE